MKKNIKGGATTRSKKSTSKDSFAIALKNYNETQVSNTYDVLIRPTLFDNIIDEKFLTYSNVIVTKNKINLLMDAFKDFSVSVSLLPLDLQTGIFKTEEIKILENYKLVSNSNNIMNVLMDEELPLTMCKIIIKVSYEEIKTESITLDCFETSKKYVNDPASKTLYDNIYKIFVSSLALNNNYISEDLEKIAIFINILGLITSKSIPKIRFDLTDINKNTNKNTSNLNSLFQNFNFNGKKSNSNIKNIEIQESDNSFIIYRDYILNRVFRNIQIRKNVENTKAKIIEIIKEQELEEFKEIKENIKLIANNKLNIEIPLPFEYDEDGNVIMTNAITGEKIIYSKNKNDMNIGGTLKKTKKPKSKV